MIGFPIHAFLKGKRVEKHYQKDRVFLLKSGVQGIGYKIFFKY